MFFLYITSSSPYMYRTYTRHTRHNPFTLGHLNTISSVAKRWVCSICESDGGRFLAQKHSTGVSWRINCPLHSMLDSWILILVIGAKTKAFSRWLQPPVTSSARKQVCCYSWPALAFPQRNVTKCNFMLETAHGNLAYRAYRRYYRSEALSAAIPSRVELSHLEARWKPS